MDRNAFECGPGWHGLIDPLITRLTELGGTATQIKEKYGELRFYYHENENDTGSVADWERFEEAILEAEQQSRHTCEMCGAPGVLMIKGGWYKTVCKPHAKELGYKDKA